MPKDQENPKAPESPDELNGGLRGRISGVTRVGPKALATAAAITAALVLAIMWGVNRPVGPAGGVAQAPTLATTPKAEPHFGADVPIVATPEPTEAPITLPTNNGSEGDDVSTKPKSKSKPVPNLAAQTARESAAQQALEQSRINERQARRALLDQAIHSTIMTGGNINKPVGDNGANGANAAANCIDATGQHGGNAGQQTAQQAQQQAQQQPYAAAAVAAAGGSRDFLNGPLGQYSCLASAETVKEQYLDSQRALPRSTYEVLAGSIIPAALITGINSELAGIVSAQVREDVFDTKTGRYLLIPRGTRLLGLYRNSIGYGQSRVLVAWTRMIFPDTTGINLMGMTAADVEGYAGLSGTVDNHYGKLFGAALLTSVLAAGVQLSQPQQTNQLFPNPQQLAASAASQNILQLGNTLAGRALGIAPVVNIPKGYPFVVIVDKDIVFPGTYQGT
jgi:type IV secretory pathway VirB10-like protein